MQQHLCAEIDVDVDAVDDDKEGINVIFFVRNRDAEMTSNARLTCTTL